MQLLSLEPGQKIQFNILNNQLQLPDTREQIFLDYLNLFGLVQLLTKDFLDFRLQPVFLYFSPYRGADQQSLQANLSAQTFNSAVGQYFSSTSKNVTSLIGLASLYFAEKRRNLENTASDSGFREKWEQDGEVRLVTKYLKLIGYDWDLRLLDKFRNIYEIAISKGGRNFSIGQASSGEKEIINFLLGIFAFNIRNGIVIVDEPEVHLHPKWQSVLIDLFLELSYETGNQFIISTHSSIFITERTLNNVIRVYKDQTNMSCIAHFNTKSNSSTKDLLHIINSTNNEKMFFADKVVLVEGITDRLIFQKMIGSILNSSKSNKVIETIDVKGKINLQKYREFLDAIGTDTWIIADLDYVNQIGDSTLKSLFVTNEKKIDDAVIKDVNSIDGASLTEKLEKSLETGQLEGLRSLWEYIKSFRRKLHPDLTEEQKKLLHEFIASIAKEKIFILDLGDIEDYLPDKYSRKDVNNVIELTRDENFEKWINDEDDWKMKLIKLISERIISETQ